MTPRWPRDIRIETAPGHEHRGPSQDWRNFYTEGQWEPIKVDTSRPMCGRTRIGEWWAEALVAADLPREAEPDTLLGNHLYCCAPVGHTREHLVVDFNHTNPAKKEAPMTEYQASQFDPCSTSTAVVKL